MRIEAPLPEFFHRHRTLVFVLAVLSTYAVAVPPAETFGSTDIEHLKDVLALALALVGLTLRSVAIGAVARENVATPPYVANWLIVIGLFLMHGHFYVFVFGLAICAAVQLFVLRRDTPAGCDDRPLRKRGAGFLSRFAAGLARDWRTAALTVAVLLVTEFYEELHVAGATSLQLVFIVLSMVTLVATFVVALRAGDVAKESFAPAGPVTQGIRVDGRVGSVDILENLISLGRLSAIIEATLDAAALRPGDRIVDVGCGSGRLVIEAASRFHNGAQIDALGIDATPGMIDLARANARRAGLPVRFEVGIGEALPLADASVDAITSSYFFHHLPSDAKRQALREMARALKPGGRIVITDYGKPAGVLGQIAALPMRFNFYEFVRGQLAGELEAIIEEEGLGPIERVGSFLGYVNVSRLVKPVGGEFSSRAARSNSLEAEIAGSAKAAMKNSRSG